jgi:hypothetical protein
LAFKGMIGNPLCQCKICPLATLLDMYANQGIENIEDLKVLRLYPFDRFGIPVEIVKAFCGRRKFEQALKELETSSTEVLKRRIINRLQT